MKQCPACGAQNAPDVPSCSICGAALGEVSSNVAARTLFGMPAVKIDQLEAQPAKPVEAPASAAPKGSAPAASKAPAQMAPKAPEPSFPPSNAATRPGFRALGAVELDGSVGGSVDIAPDLAQTTVGMAVPDLPGAKRPAAAPAASLLAPIEDGPKATLMGAPSPFSSVEDAPAPEAPAADDYKTLLGPPQPIADAIKARDAARAAAAAAPPAQDYRTLVGAPGSVADAARARDAERARREAASSSPVEPMPGVTSGPSIIVDQQAFAESLAAEAGAIEPTFDDEPDPSSVIVDEPPLQRGVGASLRPMPGDSDAARGEVPATAEIKRPGGAAERAAAARFAQALADGEARVARGGSGRIWLGVLVVLALIGLAVWLSRSGYAAEPEPAQSGAVSGAVSAPDDAR